MINNKNPKNSMVIILAILLVIQSGLAQSIRNEKELLCIGALPSEKEESIYFKELAYIGVDQYGYIYAFDPNAHHFIFKMNRKGELISKISRQGSGPGDLYRPFMLRVKYDRIFVKDQFGLSIFDLNGKFISKFRFFRRLISFDVHENKIYAIEEGTSHLFTVYDFNGKKLNIMSELPYKIDYSIFKNQDKDYIDGIFKTGKVLCGDDSLFFVSNIFGEIHKYDYTGKLIFKGLPKEIDVETLVNNRNTFFKKGLKQGEAAQWTDLFIDVVYNKKKLYFLKFKKAAHSEYEEIIEFDTIKFDIIDRYVFNHTLDSRRVKFTGIQFLVETMNNSDLFYVSLLTDLEREIYIKIFKKEKGK